jgi:protein TonB
MIHDIAIFDSSAPSLSPEKAARSFHAERVPLAPPPPDRDFRWRWGVAILAALLLHLGVITTIDDGFQRSKPAIEPPVPVEIVTEPPAPPKPVVKPPEQKPPVPQQKTPPSSGGNKPDETPGGSTPSTQKGDTPPPPSAASAQPLPERPAPTAAPTLPEEATPQAVPVPPASSPRETQQALVPAPVPLKKPPIPPSHQVTKPEAPSTKTTVGSMDLVTWGREGGGDKYLNAMRDKVVDHYHYPPTAEMFHVEGIAQYEIIVNRQGQILEINVVQSSGTGLLDKSGFEAIQSSSPFDPIPANVDPSNNRISLLMTMRMPIRGMQ